MPDTDPKFDELKQKYAPVLRLIEQEGVSLSHLDLRDGKLFLQGVAHSEDARNKILNEIQRINPDWQSDLTCDLRSERQQTDAPQAGQTVVQSGQGFANRN